MLLDSSGRSGRHATNPGRNGIDQPKANDAPNTYNHGNGMNAESGRHGTPAENGYRGENGENCMDGTLFVFVDQNNNLVMNGSNKNLSGTCPFGKEKVKISMRGGNGGNGSDGGRGGHGGSGGNGSKGSDANHINPVPGNGGNGGIGGDSGPGGDGGHGGSAGNGGNLIVQSHDARLLFLFEIDCSAGTPGMGGKGGAPGNPGFGGRGASGGKALPPHTSNALSGLDGANGRSGAWGQSGVNGSAGKNGSVTYQVISPEGFVIESSNQLYHPKIISYDIEAVVDDGILEPGEEVLLKNIIIQNDGGMTCPETNLGISSNNMILTSLSLPIIPSGTRWASDKKYKFLLPSLLIKENDATSYPLDLMANIDLFSIPFAIPCLKALRLEYPIKMNSIKAPIQMGYGDSKKIHLDIINISLASYGLKFGSHFELEYKIALKGDLHFAYSDSSEIYGTIDCIDPTQTITITHDIMMGFETQYYDKTSVKCELYLKKTMIQNISTQIQCVPYFSRENDFDILLFTDKNMNDLQFKNLNQIFTSLKLKINIWDIDFYGGVSYNLETRELLEEAKYWIDLYRNKTIIIASNYKDILKFVPTHIFGHFVEGPNPFDSGFLILNTLETQSIMTHLFTLAPKERDLTQEEFSDEFRFTSPSKEAMVQKCKNLNSEFESKDKLNRYRIRGEFKPFQISSFSWSLSWKYSYGNASLFKFPIPKNALFLYTFEKVYPVLLDMKNVVIMGSLFRLLMSILMSLNMETKFALFLHKWEEWKFKGEVDIQMEDLIKNVVVFDFVRNYELTSKFDRFEHALTLLKKNPNLFVKNIVGTLIFALHDIKKKNTPSKWNLFADKTKANEIDAYIKEFEDKLANVAVIHDMRSYEVKTWIQNPNMNQVMFVQQDLFRYILDD